METGRKAAPFVSGCNEKGNCPFSLGGARGLIARMEDLLEEEGLARRIAELLPKPGLARHAFRAAVAECPNACSQPQIKDFGVIQESLPGKGEGICTNCGACVKACRENGIDLDKAGPSIDYAKCMRCGACVKACPEGALAAQKKGFSVYIGGRLGRHPRLGLRVLEMAAEESVLRALRAAVRLYAREGSAGERFGDLADRLGTGPIKEELEAAVKDRNSNFQLNKSGGK